MKIADLLPQSAQFPAANFPQYVLSNRQLVLAFDASTTEECFWAFSAPSGITAPYTAYIGYTMSGATSGNVQLQLALEAVSDGDALNINTTDSFDSYNTVTSAVPGTAGYLEVAPIVLSGVDSIAAFDYVRVRFRRNSVGNTATGDLYHRVISIYDSR